MELGLILSIIGIMLAIIGIILALIALVPGKFQRKPKLRISPGNMGKIDKIKIGQKFGMCLQIVNDGETVLIDEINLCMPTQFKEIASGHSPNDEYGRRLFTWGHKLDICEEFFTLAITFLLYGNKLAKNSSRIFCVSFVPEILGTYKIPVIIYAEVDKSVLKFPFKYMANRKERIRNELIIEVVDEI